MRLLLCVLAASGLFLGEEINGVVATVNGKPMTADQVRKMVAGLPAVAQKAFKDDPKKFLQEYAWYQRTQELALKNELDKTSPWRENLEFQRLMMLVNAQFDHAYRDIEVSAEQQRSAYDANIAKYREVRAKLIYLPFSSQTSGSEAESKAKAEMIVRQARAGSDFVKLVKEHSKDAASSAQNGDIGMAIRATTTQIPEPMRKAVLALKANEVSEPLRHENGYYVFRADTSGVLPYEQVKDEIYKELKDIGFKQWQEKTKAESAVKFENESFFANVSKVK